jgi:Xaa-Pro aminopeptidase
VTVRQQYKDPAVDLAVEKIDAFLVTSPANVRYLSGFTGSNGMLLATGNGTAVFFTDPRYALQSSQEVSCTINVVPRGGLIAAVAQHIRRRRIRRVGFEKNHISYQQFSFLDQKLPEGVTLKPIDGAVERQRMVKSESELAAIRASVLTNSRAFDRTLKKIKAGITETEIAAELDYQMRKLGAESCAFETIVASGERTALPHARPTTRRVGDDELVLIDMGASQAGYASDMTRMVHVGRRGRKAEQLYRAVLEAQLAAIDAVRSDIPASRVDAAARQVLKRHGLDKNFTHSTGHGLGLEIHEPPRLGRGDKTRLESGMAITIEPGVYLPGFGGVRIEDTVVVGGAGCEVLTPTSKELITV